MTRAYNVFIFGWSFMTEQPEVMENSLRAQWLKVDRTHKLMNLMTFGCSLCLTLHFGSACPCSSFSVASNREFERTNRLMFSAIWAHYKLAGLPQGVCLCWVILDVLCISSFRLEVQGSVGRNCYPPSKIDRLFWDRLRSEMNWEVAFGEPRSSKRIVVDR